MTKRRLDRVLAPGYLDGLATAPLPQIRELRLVAEQEEVDLSYLRRLLQGRIDILGAELAGRSAEDEQSLLDRLPRILAEETRPPARGLGRHSVLEPSPATEQRRAAEALVADPDIDDVSARTDAELSLALDAYAEQERRLSAQRHALHAVIDACTAEITRRYRDGEADVGDLLKDRSATR